MLRRSRAKPLDLTFEHHVEDELQFPRPARANRRVQHAAARMPRYTELDDEGVIGDHDVRPRCLRRRGDDLPLVAVTPVAINRKYVEENIPPDERLMGRGEGGNVLAELPADFIGETGAALGINKAAFSIPERDRDLACLCAVNDRVLAIPLAQGERRSQ